jgi:hypothetical protein
MTSEAAVLAVIDALHSCAIPYMLVGALSSNAYGVERSTRYADFVVELGNGSVAEVASRLGVRFRLDPQMSFETTTGTTRFELQVVESPFRIELFQLSSDAHDQERFRRRRVVHVLGREVFLPSAEDVIVTKLRWGRSKDQEDVRGVIAVQSVEGHLDWNYIHYWTERHGTHKLLEEIRTSIPPL